MKKVIIGILGTSEYMKTNDAFYDVYKYSNNYIKKIVENDAVPLLIPLVDDKLIEETLDMCDGLLLPGGSYIKEVNFKVIDYFYQRKKKNNKTNRYRSRSLAYWSNKKELNYFSS